MVIPKEISKLLHLGYLPMKTLLAPQNIKMFDKYGNMWHHSRVRKYLTSEDFPETETDFRPWHGLVLLLRKYPEHFVINIRKGGGLSTEFVSLVSLQS
ncbi:hypothetical protein SORBI_3005G111550 [Sorghum bicolor]|uniref:Uncharacterized protein n=1 Tax=Sorghum bicolor TaxID=4558 RepID=A0A1Z5RJ86_SORBI|nr:hypothetical protein SORBI_3005G111550 [Sorghum bicolor]